MMDWIVEYLDEDVKAELDEQPMDVRASFERIVQMISSFGLVGLREPYVKHLEGALWEMRLHGRDGIARAMYVTAAGRRIVIVSVFSKKTQKTPRKEIDVALRRAKDVR